MDQTRPKQINDENEQVGTPSCKGDKGDKKREATSPLDAQDILQKKNRHASGSSSSSDNFESPVTGLDMNDIQPNAGDFGDDVHLLSQPINPLDIVQIAGELRSMMLPELMALLTGQIPQIKGMVTEAVQEGIRSLNEKVSSLKEENKRLTKVNEDLEKRVTQIEHDNDALEQYSRRNSIRISGVPEVASEDTDDVIIQIAQELDVTINRSDIDRSHRVGKIDDRGRSSRTNSSKRRHRDILVKFSTYNARQRLYQSRKDLRDRNDMKHLYLNEDLTKIRSKLLYDARCLVRVHKLKTAYASDGKIFVRDNDEHRHLMKTDSDLALFGDPKEARKELAKPTDLPAPTPSTSAGGAHSMDS